MSAEEVTTWEGASGGAYEFFIFAIDIDVPLRPGLFIYSKKTPEAAWVAVYMGHGDLAARCQDAGLLECIRGKGATHVHLRLNKRDEDRIEEWRDLLAHASHVFAPDGCQPEADRPPAPR